MAIWG